MIGEITDRIVETFSGNGEIVYVTGLRGVGKTHFSQALQHQLGGIIVASDWYLKHSSHVRHQRMQAAARSRDPLRIDLEENPVNWYDWETLIQDLGKLSTGQGIEINNAWDRTTGEKDLSFPLKPELNGLIWCEGICLLHHPIVDAADISILLVAPAELARQRAEERDGSRSTPEYLAYKETLMHKYDLPYYEAHKSVADIIIDNNDFTKPMILD